MGGGRKGRGRLAIVMEGSRLTRTHHQCRVNNALGGSQWLPVGEGGLREGSHTPTCPELGTRTKGFKRYAVPQTRKEGGGGRNR